MNPAQPGKSRFPLLEMLLASKDLPFKAIYSLGDVAGLFGVSKRAIQHRTKSGQLKSRNLPGRARFLASDIELFIASSEA